MEETNAAGSGCPGAHSRCADKENLLAELEDVESSTSREQGNG